MDRFLIIKSYNVKKLGYKQNQWRVYRGGL